MNLPQIIGIILAGASQCFALYHAAILGAAIIMLPDLRHARPLDSALMRRVVGRVMWVLAWQIMAVITLVLALR